MMAPGTAMAARDSVPPAVLLFSHNVRTLGTLAEVLGVGGERVLTATNVGDAWQCLKTGEVSVVVLDLTGPDLDDLAFMHALRTQRLCSDLPMIFLTPKNYNPPALPALGGDLVLDGWLSIPCSSEQLRLMVRRLIQQRPQPQHGSTGRAAEASGGAAPPQADPTPHQAPAVSITSLDEPGNASLAVPSLFSGLIGAIEVPQILTMLETLRLTGELTIRSGSREGKIFFVQGTVWHAQFEEIEGSESLFLLFHLKEGGFSFDARPAIANRTIFNNTTSLLLEGMRQMDETIAAIKTLQQQRVRRMSDTMEYRPVGPPASI